MVINKNISDREIIAELGKRIKACRIRKEYTQSEFARVSGVSIGTITNIESGESIQLLNLLKMLRELDLTNSLDLLLPSAESSPMELIKSKEGKKRQRVRKTSAQNTITGEGTFRWGDEL